METCIEKLEKASTEIDKLFNKVKDAAGEKYVVKDGIINIRKYCKSKYKILWVLKEANDDYGDYDMRKGLLKRIKTKSGIIPEARPTFAPIIYTAHGILNNCYWDDVADLDKEPSVADIIELIGIVNVKKLPGGSISIENDLQNASKQHGHIVVKQIVDFEPDIIIFGNTMDYIKDELQIKEENERQLNNLNTQLDNFNRRLNYPKFYIQNDKIYINAYHPSFWPKKKGDKEKYVDGIINAVRFWINSKKV